MLWIAALAPPASAAGFALPELMQMLAGVPAARASFVETRQVALLSQPLVVTGRLAWNRPDRLERHVLTPNDERIVIVGTEVTVENRARRQTRTFSLAASPALFALIESLRGTLAGDLPALQRHFAVALEGQRDNWTLVLVPGNAELAAAITRIRMSGVGAGLRRIEIDEAGGDRSVTTLSDDPR
jgi:outer membrane lipoprotein-sorting protein